MTKTSKNIKTENPVCTKCFNTLGVSSRMRIYRFLRDKGEETVGAVVNIIKLTQPTVSYHLKEMKESGLLKSRKSGKEVYYSINPDCEMYEEECVLHKVLFPGEEK
jgi:DNA-binding transcriptional ArsR family regulator